MAPYTNSAAGSKIKDLLIIWEKIDALASFLKNA